MIRLAHPPQPAASAPIEVRVLGPDSPELLAMDVRPHPGHGTRARLRREQLSHATRLVARFGSHTVGVAAYERQGTELRVLDLVIEPAAPLCGSEVAAGLLNALEVAALAGGCRRVVLLPAAVAAASSLDRLGYRIADGASGGWLEKTFTS